MTGTALSTGDAEWKPSVNPWLIAGAVILATFIEVLDTTIVSVALPNMAGSLGATNEEATWVLTSYLVANAVILPASGWLSTFFGRKRFLMCCVAIFTFASFLCAFAPSMEVLVIARILQGAGGGALQPLSQAILMESFPKEKRGMANAMFGLCVVVAPVIGPSLGGWLTDNYSWRWVFNINLPIGIFALFLMSRFLEDPPYIKSAKPGRIDGIGFGFLTIWLATLQIVLDKGQQQDWMASSWIRWFSFVSVAALIAFTIRELRAKEPIVNLKVFLNWNFAIGTFLMTIIGAVLYSSLTILPLFLQTLMGYTSELSGYAMTPRGLGAVIAMPLVGLLINRVDSRLLLVTGILILAFSNVMLGGLNLNIGMSNIVWPNLVQGFSLGFIFVPLMTNAMGNLKNEQMGNAAGIFNLMRNLGGSIGISITNTWLARNTQNNQALMVGHLSPYDPVYQQQLAGMKQGLTTLTGAQQADQAAHSVINGILLQQANLQAYINTFWWVSLVVIICIPAALMMRKSVMKAGVAMH